ncbi:nuclear distribution protein nudE-like 1-B isoform X2 [Diaphorina citri]|uniref:Nuclear distribution protein nudE-like 1-B isoform X2 n=1 Tax=Diaphorina citri TaxID=121845 RepID=A0A1S3DD42_DIACI|nr:nuclear distribution protein nudE-like 1-B isoform X2 [Diaphorina citri]
MAEFKDKDEEIKYWKEKCIELEKDLAELSESSKQVENELEALLQDADKNNKELRTKNNRMKLDFETLQDKLSQFQEDSFRQIEELQQANTTFQEREENYKKYIRELEQKNDDLERSQRETHTSYREYNEKFNGALEKIAILQDELCEKESLKATVQRLKDEASELRQEIKIQEKKMLSEQEKSAADRRRSSFRLATMPGSLDIGNTAPNKNKNSAQNLRKSRSPEPPRAKTMGVSSLCCPTCGRRCKNKSGLASHMRSHKTEPSVPLAASSRTRRRRSSVH